MKLSKFDVTKYLGDEKSIALYLDAALAENDPSLYLHALGDVAKARGMTEVAAKAGLGRESLYKALAPGASPRFETIMKVGQALGIRFHAVAEPVAVYAAAKPVAPKTPSERAKPQRSAVRA